MKRLLLAMALVSFLLVPVMGGAAEKFPIKPIELDVPFAAGGSTDVWPDWSLSTLPNISTSPWSW
jgi:tripartite-type tricarboxylate transporter receptor subunit TctC